VSSIATADKPVVTKPMNLPVGIEAAGLTNTGPIHMNLSVPLLYEAAVRRNEGVIAPDGALVVRTGQHTGRSAQDKYIVDDDSTHAHVWWGKSNVGIDPTRFDALHRCVLAYLQHRELFVQDSYAGADPNHRLRVRVISEFAWASLFARTLFIRPNPRQLPSFAPDFTILHAPNFHATPELDGTRTGTFIILNMKKRLILIGGTSYAGEIKKSIFTVMNYILPLEGVFSMHCSANVGERDDVALFFGLSGTGKTTLSADPDRFLIGDDEHGWSDGGVFNFEGGCYAKVIRLSQVAEPDIYAAIHRFGAVLENVVCDPVTRALDLDDASLTENTRAAYPLEFIRNHVPTGHAGHPANIIMLTADAFGVMPPIAKLSPAQAMYYFISGYTAKLAGTEKGLGSEPQATFSTCFGAPFMALHPKVYAGLLAERMRKHNATAWLVNTGWSGGPFGVGERISIAHTRAMIKAALSGALDKVATRPDPVFGIGVPVSCPDVPSIVLDPRSTWPDPAKYDAAARDLAKRFRDNFKQFERDVPAEVTNAGPRGA